MSAGRPVLCGFRTFTRELRLPTPEPLPQVEKGTTFSPLRHHAAMAVNFRPVIAGVEQFCDARM